MSLRAKQPKNDKVLQGKKRKMKDAGRVEGQVTEQLEILRRRTTELEALQAGHKQLEIELQQSEEKYRSLFELAQDSIMLTDSEGVITSFNAAGLKQTGYTEREIVGQHFTTLPLFRPQDI